MSACCKEISNVTQLLVGEIESEKIKEKDDTNIKYLMCTVFVLKTKIAYSSHTF